MSTVNKSVYQAILAINKLLEGYISGVSFYSTMESFLELLLATTQSENGFIAKFTEPDKQFITLVCNKDSQGMGFSLEQVRQTIGAITLDKTTTNFYDCTSSLLRSYTSVPIEFDGKLIGYIGLTNKPTQYSKSDFEILRFAKNNISSIFNHQLNFNIQHHKSHKEKSSHSLPLYISSVQ